MNSTIASDSTCIGLFAGVGGIELGLHRAGFHSVLLSEIETGARTVLEHRFPDVELVGDIRDIRSIPTVDVVAGGFPCQDLSQAGRTAGIRGDHSGLVGEVFRLLEASDPKWLLLENVPFMLQLDRGRAMDFLTTRLEAMGFSWAYRVVDARSFGLPQRRQRVLLVASRTGDPRRVLFADEAGEREFVQKSESAYGFYWTEGLRGLGWAVDAVPTLKSGSTIGIPSPPAMWMPDGSLMLPDIRDAERLQGFDADWTVAAAEVGRRGESHRWKLVGNAVCVEMSTWVGSRLAHQGEYEPVLDRPDPRALNRRWPIAAYGVEGTRAEVAVSQWPTAEPFTPLAEFLQYPAKPLSLRAASGFLERARRGSLRFPHGFLDAVEAHIDKMRHGSGQLVLAR